MISVYRSMNRYKTMMLADEVAEQVIQKPTRKKG